MITYKKILLGKVDNENIYLSPPSWDCGWYWGFGYLGNRNCHYHIDGLNPKVDLQEAITEHFGSTLKIRVSDVWTFAELMKTFYSLKGAANILGSGSAGYTSNPVKDIIINKDEVKRINEVVLPAVFESIYSLLERNLNNEALFNKLVKINLEGDTKKTVAYMVKHNIKTDDLKSIEGVTPHDFNIIHSLWWKQFHAKK